MSDLSILQRENIIKLPEGTKVSGYALIQSCKQLSTKTGGSYLAGNLHVKGQLPYKIWSDVRPGSAFAVLSVNPESFANKICIVDGKVDMYGGTPSLVIDGVELVDKKSVNLTTLDFFQEVYDANAWWGKLESILKKNCSATGFEVFSKLIAPYKERFMMEFAAVSHHDNCCSGLLAHTTKVVRLANMLKMYPALMERCSPDLLFISCALHDLGKVREYSEGTMSKWGTVLSHNTFGVMMLAENEEMIITSMGERFYCELLAVVTQHHGEYGERPRTLAAYVVHLLDALEANLTSLNSLAADAKPGDTIAFNGFKLN